MIKLHPELAVDGVREDLAAHGFAQLRPFLATESAAQLAAELTSEKDWDLAITGRSGPLAISAAELKEMPPARHTPHWTAAYSKLAGTKNAMRSSFRSEGSARRFEEWARRVPATSSEACKRSS